MTSMTPGSARYHLYDLDLERRILGALLTDFEAAREAASSLIAEEFMLSEHAVLFEAIFVLDASGGAPSGDRVAEFLAERGFLSAVPAISECVEEYLPSADEPRLPLFIERIRMLAALRSFLRLAGRVDSVLRDRRRNQGSRIEAAYKLIREAT